MISQKLKNLDGIEKSRIITKLQVNENIRIAKTIEYNKSLIFK